MSDDGSTESAAVARAGSTDSRLLRVVGTGAWPPTS